MLEQPPLSEEVVQHAERIATDVSKEGEEEDDHEVDGNSDDGKDRSKTSSRTMKMRHMATLTMGRLR